MNSILVIVFIILFFFIIKFICVCHKEYFISNSMINDTIKYPNNIDKYYLLNKKSRTCVDSNDKNIIRDVSEIIDSYRNSDEVYDIYDMSSVGSDNKFNMGFW